MRFQRRISHWGMAALLLAGILAGCTKETDSGGTGGPSQQNTTSAGGKKKIVFVFKSAGSTYSETCKAGAQQASDDPALNADVTYQAAPEGTSEKQADIINQAVVGHADAIVVSPVDAQAIIPAINSAIAAGVKVFTWDADSPGSKRLFYVAAVDDVQIGTDIADALAKSIGGKGKVLISSGDPTADNLNKHIQGMEEGFKKYPGIQLVKPYIYNQEDAGKATTMTAQALQKDPDIAGIACANSQGPPGAGEALRKVHMVGKVKVWGLALPSATATYLKDGSVTGLYLWDPQKLTYLTAKLVKDALDGKMPQDGEEIGGGKLGVKGAIVTLPIRLEITKDNVDTFHF